jgi:predicted amidohydrolase
MEPVMVACVQQRMRITETPQDFEAEARRFLHQAQAKAAQIVIFPELTGLMLAPGLISNFKLGFIKREARGKQPGAGLLSQSLGRVAGSTVSALGGGFRGSLARLVDKNSDAFRDVYFETFGHLAREYGMSILGGSIYLYDPETKSVRHRAYLFDVDGEVVGYQEKMNLGYHERDLATPGSDLTVLESRFGRVGVLIGQDVMYPELARLLAVQGVDLLVGIAAAPGSAMGRMMRTALALRVEENQIFGAASFLLGPNLLGQENVEDYYGQSAVLAPISLTAKGQGVLIQTGTDRTEGIISAELNMDELHELRQSSRFRPRQEMNLGNLGPVLAEMYQQGWSVDEAMARRVSGPLEPVAEPLEIEAEPLPEAVEPPQEPPVSSESEASVPDAMSLTESRKTEP